MKSEFGKFCLLHVGDEVRESLAWITKRLLVSFLQRLCIVLQVFLNNVRDSEKFPRIHCKRSPSLCGHATRGTPT